MERRRLAVLLVLLTLVMVEMEEAGEQGGESLSLTPAQGLSPIQRGVPARPAAPAHHIQELRQGPEERPEMETHSRLIFNN